MNNNKYQELINNWRINKCLKSRNEVVNEALNLVTSILKNLRYLSDPQDLYHEGAIALIEAIDTYDGTLGDFLPYAKVLIRYRILNYLRTDKTIPTGSSSMHSHNLSSYPVPESHSEILKLMEEKGVPYSTAMNYALSPESPYETIPEVLGKDSTYLGAQLLERLEHLSESLKQLKLRDSQILNEYFIQERTLQEIGDSIGYTNQGVRYIIKTSIEKLRRNI